MRARSKSLVVSACLLVACSHGDGATLPPLAQQAEPELPGKFVWHNLVTPDAESARSFYGGVFGWDFEVLEDGLYTKVSYKGRNLGGIVEVPKAGDAPRSSFWLNAVSVPELDRALQSALDAGGKQLAASTEIPGVGRVAVISDPQGAVVQLIHASGGDPPDEVAPMHTWLWHELIANDPSGAVDFYRNVFGYEVQALGTDDSNPYLLLQSHGTPRGGVLMNPFDETRPAWVPYVRVEDPADLLRAVKKLGGRVVIEPSPDLRGGTLALILDPSGAPIALQKWNPGNTKANVGNDEEGGG
jgi:predicted enzyme related to lactoylglutathione lyase